MIFLLAVLLFLIAFAVDQITSDFTVTFLCTIAGVGVLVYGMKARLDKKQRSAAFSLIDRHAGELKVRRSQLTVRQSYGLTDDSGWKKEQTRFINKIIIPAVGGKIQKRVIIDVVGRINEVTQGFNDVPVPMLTQLDPIAYEHHVAGLLRSLGWDANATQVSGDQGIDVIAIKNGAKLVVQCKLYSKPVGNAAVQEIVAGQIFERANYAAVVSNAGFTKSAKQLASSSGVFLLHHDQIAELDAACVGAVSIPSK